MSGDFFYPTLSGCSGSVKFVTELDGAYEFYRDNTSSLGTCRQNSRVNFVPKMQGAEQVIEYKLFNPSTNVESFFGILRMISTDPETLVTGSWRGLVTGSSGEVFLELNLETGDDEILSGDYNYRTITGCNGSVNFVTKEDGVYEFYQDNTSSLGTCRQNARVSVALVNEELGEMLQYTLYSPETNDMSTYGAISRQ